MKKIIAFVLAALMLLSLVAAAFADDAGYADTVVIGRIYTSDESQPWAEAMAVKDGVFTYVGDAEGVKALIGPETEVTELGEGMATASLIDAHTHPATVGSTGWHVKMGVPESYEELMAFITEYLAEHPAEEEPYVYFEYFPSNMFGTDGPRKEWLDEIAPDRPILVRDFSDHASWVNSKFLELIGAYELDPSDPAISSLVVGEDGDFTGWVKEFSINAILDNMWEKLGWYPPEEPTVEVMEIVTGDLKQWGVTGVFDAFIEDAQQVISVHDMDEAGELNMYYEMSLVLSDFADLEDNIAILHYFEENYSTEHFHINTMKIFYDGTNELGDSALIDGTVDDPDNHGYMIFDYDETKEVIRRCNEEGIDVHFHLVGDLAFRTICDATEELINELGALDIQVEMTHCEYVDEADMLRVAPLGIIVNWTPHWSGGYFGDAALLYLGEERYNKMYQFNTMMDSGAIVTFGSDVYSMFEENRANPYFGMQTAMTRVDIEWPLDTEGNMRPSEDAKLSLEKLIKGYTINAAIQLRVDDVTGSIEVGKSANYNLYAEDLFSVPEFEFQYVLPTLVVFEGRVIAEN